MFNIHHKIVTYTVAIPKFYCTQLIYTLVIILFVRGIVSLHTVNTDIFVQITIRPYGYISNFTVCIRLYMTSYCMDLIPHE